jgi:hypothetical protein
MYTLLSPKMAVCDQSHVKNSAFAKCSKMERFTMVRDLTRLGLGGV